MHKIVILFNFAMAAMGSGGLDKKEQSASKVPVRSKRPPGPWTCGPWRCGGYYMIGYIIAPVNNVFVPGGLGLWTGLLGERQQFVAR